jgi:hypothetical protein
MAKIRIYVYQLMRVTTTTAGVIPIVPVDISLISQTMLPCKDNMGEASSPSQRNKRKDPISTSGSLLFYLWQGR